MKQYLNKKKQSAQKISISHEQIRNEFLLQKFKFNIKINFFVNKFNIGEREMLTLNYPKDFPLIKFGFKVEGNDLIPWSSSTAQRLTDQNLDIKDIEFDEKSQQLTELSDKLIKELLNFPEQLNENEWFVELKEVGKEKKYQMCEIEDCYGVFKLQYFVRDDKLSPTKETKEIYNAQQFKVDGINYSFDDLIDEQEISKSKNVKKKIKK